MVIILDEKAMLPPPPPYASSSEPLSPPPFPGHGRRKRVTLSTLPPHILLYVVHQTLPQSDGKYGGESKVERQRKVLYWMTNCLRLVSRSMYIACMHVLRSTYLPAYASLIKAPYSSDPFPLSSPSPIPHSHLMSPVNSEQRETQVLDLFLSVKVREDVWADDTEFHLEREESFKDLFDLMQPRSRLEDLVRAYGVKAGVVSVTSASGNVIVSSTPTTPTMSGPTPMSSACAVARGVVAPPRQPKSKKQLKLPFNALSVSFSPRSVGLVYVSKGTKRTIVQITRERDEQLEFSAKRLVRELGAWLAES